MSAGMILTTELKPETIAFNKAIIEHPRFKAGIAMINQVHRFHNSKPKGLMVLGPTGTGKTTILEEYRRRYQVAPQEDREIKPIILVDTPASNSVDVFYSAILEQLGAPDFERGRAPLKRKKIIRLTKELQVQLIIFDEIQNLLPVNAQASTRKVSNTLKALMNTLKIPMVLAGLPSAENLLLTQPELGGRFLRPYRLIPMMYHNDEHRTYFQSYLRSLQAILPVETVDIFEPEIAARFFLATKGHARDISYTIDMTLENSDLSKPLQASNYAIGFGLACSNGLAEEFNPFTAPFKDVEHRLQKGGFV